MQHNVAKSSARIRWLTVLAGLMAVLLVGALVYIRYSYVMQFAEVEQIKIVPSARRAGAVDISYQPVTAGKIEFVRKTDDRLETLLDYADNAKSMSEAKQFTWAGNDSRPFTVTVRWRQGWGLVDEKWSSPAKM